jgi:uncharacterized protein (UPF0548 family)
MRACVCTADGTVAAGAVVIQRVLLGPLALETAVRVVEVFDRPSSDDTEAHDVGFSYVTLVGHMERGTAGFFLRRARDGVVTFNVESWSRPGNVLAALGRPFARAVQKRFTAEALSAFVAALA